GAAVAARGRQRRVRRACPRGRRQPPGTYRGRGAFAGTGRCDHAGLVAGPWLFHAAARRPHVRHLAAVAEGHHDEPAVRSYAEEPGTAAAGIAGAKHRRIKESQRCANSTARPLLPTIFTLSRLHWKLRAI